MTAATAKASKPEQTSSDRIREEIINDNQREFAEFLSCATMADLYLMRAVLGDYSGGRQGSEPFFLPVAFSLQLGEDENDGELTDAY